MQILPPFELLKQVQLGLGVAAIRTPPGMNWVFAELSPPSQRVLTTPHPIAGSESKPPADKNGAIDHSPASVSYDVSSSLLRLGERLPHK